MRLLQLKILEYRDKYQRNEFTQNLFVLQRENILRSNVHLPQCRIVLWQTWNYIPILYVSVGNQLHLYQLQMTISGKIQINVAKEELKNT